MNIQTEDDDSCLDDNVVLLEYLVLEKVVSLMKQNFTATIAQKQVSRTFASTMVHKKLTLEIAYPPYENEELNFNLTLSISSGLWIKQIFAKEDSLSPIVQRIFAYFRQVDLKLNGIKLEFIASAVIAALTLHPKISVKYLEIKPSSMIGHGVEPQPELEWVSCHQLIDVLSSQLKILILHIDRKNFCQTANCQVHKNQTPEVLATLEKKLWQSVSGCSGLVKLSTMFGWRSSNHYLSQYRPSTHSTLSHLQECLKLLKIGYYRINLDNKYLLKNWLASSFADNGHFRNLDFTGQYMNNYRQFDEYSHIWDDNFLPILSRLDSLKIRVQHYIRKRKRLTCSVGEWYGDSFSDIEPIVRRILSVMGTAGILKISNFTCHSYGDYEDMVVKTLQLYLKLSNEYGRRIKVRLNLNWPDYSEYSWIETPPGLYEEFYGKYGTGDVHLFKRVLARLSSTEADQGLALIRLGTWVRILLGKANVLVKIRYQEEDASEKPKNPALCP